MLGFLQIWGGGGVEGHRDKNLALNTPNFALDKQTRNFQHLNQRNENYQMDNICSKRFENYNFVNFENNCDYKKEKISIKSRSKLKIISILFLFLIIGFSFILGLTYSAFSSTAKATGSITFAINGHSGELSISNGVVSAYDTSVATNTKFTITPNQNYSLPSNISIKMGGNTFSNYTFSNGVLTISNTAVTTSPLKITIVCTAPTITLTLNNQSATTAGTTSVSATYGNALPAITIPTRTGYDFKGYFTGTNGTGDQCYNANGTSTHKCAISSSATLYAYWVWKTYSITYYDGGTIRNDITPNTYTYSFGLTLPVLTSNSVEFNGWYTNSACTGSPVTNISATETGNKTFYALWGTFYTVNMSYKEMSSSFAMYYYVGNLNSASDVKNVSWTYFDAQTTTTLSLLEGSKLYLAYAAGYINNYTPSGCITYFTNYNSYLDSSNTNYATGIYYHTVTSDITMFFDLWSSGIN